MARRIGAGAAAVCLGMLVLATACDHEPKRDAGTPASEEPAPSPVPANANESTTTGGVNVDSRPDTASTETREELPRPGSRSVSITPLRTNFGAIYGAEARDEATGTLLATAKQVAVKDNMVVVEETQFSPRGDAIYKGRLFFDAGNELVKEERIDGTKRWTIFHTWISDRPGM